MPQYKPVFIMAGMQWRADHLPGAHKEKTGH
jgi:hypothetical protein